MPNSTKKKNRERNKERKRVSAILSAAQTAVDKILTPEQIQAEAARLAFPAKKRT